MVNPEDLGNNRRTRGQENTLTQEAKQTQENKAENRHLSTNTTQDFLKSQIGKLMRIEFLIGTNNLVNRIGFLEDVGESYILLKSFEGDSIIYADLYSIKFITISAAYSRTANFQNLSNMNMQGMNIDNNINRYF